VGGEIRTHYLNLIIGKVEKKANTRENDYWFPQVFVAYAQKDSYA
jgi:hypothetical protein